jgi:hypothetical protein
LIFFNGKHSPLDVSTYILIVTSGFKKSIPLASLFVFSMDKTQPVEKGPAKAGLFGCKMVK